MEIRFAIIPPARINKLTGKLSIQHAKSGKHRFVVDNVKLFPHATLFVADVPKKEYRTLLAAIKDEARKHKSFEAEILGYQILQHLGLGLKIKPSKKLTDLRKSLYKLVSQFAEMKGAANKWKYPPHLSMVRFEDPHSAKQSIKDFRPPRDSFPVKTIGLCLCKGSQVYKVLDQIKLK